MTKKTLLDKKSPLLNANNRTVRHGGIVYRISVQTMGRFLLASATPFTGGTEINLFLSKTKLAKEIRNKVEMGLFS